MPPRRALIIGAEGGIGGAVARSLADEGSELHGIGLRRPIGEAELFRGFLACDLSRPGAAEEAVRHAWSERGPFDSVLWTAGIFPAVRARDVTEELFERVFGINVRALCMAAVTCANLAVESARPLAIVLTGSGAGERPRLGTAVYAASKAATNALTRGLALELAPLGVRVNAVAPGFVDVDSDLSPVPREYVDRLAEASPEGRVAGPEDVAPVYTWLAGAESHWVNGAIVPADAGAGLGTLDAPHWLPRTGHGEP